eukprot:96573-Hanusia_phi.AAC.1
MLLSTRTRQRMSNFLPLYSSGRSMYFCTITCNIVTCWRHGGRDKLGAGAAGTRGETKRRQWSKEREGQTEEEKQVEEKQVEEKQ